MADNTTTLARRLYEAFNERDFDAAADLVAPDAVITIVGTGDTYVGPDGLRRYNTMWADAFPDGAITVDRVLADGGYVIVEFTGRGTHTGTLVTPAGSVPATGRSVTLQLCDVLEFADGRLRAQRNYFDGGALMSQLGITAEQAAPTET
jgi:steroid delta-isomerase-like uncharacterized protein